jgi:hypothetical protein
VPEKSYGAALLYFTGSKAHNIALRALANEHGWKLNEYGLFAGRRRIAGASEEEVYRKLGLAFIEPELREDRGEVAAAKASQLPRLVQLSDIRGDLHVHSDWTDGTMPIAAMAAAAKARGYEYIALTDHSRRVAMTHGLDPARLSRQMREIDRLNEKSRGFTVLKGIEVPKRRTTRFAGFDTVAAGHRGRVCTLFFRSVAPGANRSHHPRHGRPLCLHPWPPDRATDRDAGALRGRYGSHHFRGA